MRVSRSTRAIIVCTRAASINLVSWSPLFLAYMGKSSRRDSLAARETGSNTDHST